MEWEKNCKGAMLYLSSLGWKEKAEKGSFQETIFFLRGDKND